MKLYEYVIKVKDQASSHIKNIARQMGAAESKTKRVSRSMVQAESRAKSLGRSFGGLKGLIAGAFALTAVSAFAGGIVKLGVDMEQTRVSMTTFLGDAQKANKAIMQLNEFSNVTPFDNNQVIKAGKGLLAFGVKADSLVPTLQKIGDVSAGTGKDFNELATIYGKAKIAGTLYAEDINQLVEAGIPIIDKFAKQLGVSNDQVKKMASEGKLKFSNLEQAFTDLTSKGGMFHELMIKQSQTLGGKWSTLLGKAQTVGIGIGEALIPILTPLVDLGISLMENKALLIDLAWGVGIAGGAFAAYKAIVIATTAATFLYQKGVLVARIANVAFTRGFASLNAVMSANPVGLIVAALALLAGGVLYAWNNFVGFRAAIMGIWEAAKQVFTNVGTFFKQIFDPIFKAIDAFKRGDYTKAAVHAAHGLANIGPAGLAANAVKFSLEGGFTKGVEDAYKKGNLLERIKTKRKSAFSELEGGETASATQSAATSGAGAGIANNQQEKAGIDGIAAGGSGGVSITFGDVNFAEDINLYAQNIDEGLEDLELKFNEWFASLLNGSVKTATTAHG